MDIVSSVPQNLCAASSAPLLIAIFAVAVIVALALFASGQRVGRLYQWDLAAREDLSSVFELLTEVSSAPVARTWWEALQRQKKASRALAQLASLVREQQYTATSEKPLPSRYSASDDDVSPHSRGRGLGTVSDVLLDERVPDAVKAYLCMFSTSGEVKSLNNSFTAPSYICSAGGCDSTDCISSELSDVVHPKYSKFCDDETRDSVMELSSDSHDECDDSILSSAAHLREYLMFAGTDFTFNIMKLEQLRAPLSKILPSLLRCLDLQPVLGLQGLEKLSLFVAEIGDGYNNCPYHSEWHAADVASRLATILNHSGLDLFPGDTLPLITAAIAHDVDHPGKSNSFLINAGHKVARRWNDQSVLENHSLHHALKLLENSKMNFISDWQPAVQSKFRKTFISAILATDISKHFELLAQFRVTVLEKARAYYRAHEADQTARQGSQKVQKQLQSSFYEGLGPAERLLVLQMAIKVADVGHCFTPLEQHLDWVKRLEQEMFTQGDTEKQRGLPVSPLMDRDRPGVDNGSNQIGFFHALVMPMIEAWAEAFPSSSPMLHMAQQNLRYWKAQVP